MRALVVLGLALAGPAAAQVPGLRGLDHVGLTVPDAKAAVAFLTDVMGCRAAFTLGPIGFDSGDWMQEHLNVHPRTVIRSLSMVRCGNGSNVEIFQYEAPERTTTESRNSDIGGHHLAFYVADMDAAVAYLKSKDVRLLGGPSHFKEGPIGGQTINYFLAPWGAQMELISYPEGMTYEKDGGPRLWSPKDQPDLP